MDAVVIESVRKINTILEQLEKDTGCIVERLELLDVDVTNMGDSRQQLQRTVRIDLKPQPGTHWTK